jgi:hypothetical protein
MKAKYDKSRTSTELKNEFNNVCFQLGLAICKERQAAEEQEKLKDQQVELEEAYQAAMERELAQKEANEKAAAATKAFEDKAKANVGKQADAAVPTTPPTTEAAAATST